MLNNSYNIPIEMENYALQANVLYATFSCVSAFQKYSTSGVAVFKDKNVYFRFVPNKLCYKERGWRDITEHIWIHIIKGTISL